MMITEHNCEEYFLLYIDNELTAAECKTVEDFVGQHPQYIGMFNALQETKLPAEDDMSFGNKEALYKDEANDIGINNYEEYFLLYTDNELSGEQKETTERFVLQHPQLQEEFTLLQQTKLAPEIIEYKDKAGLHKKERRVLPFYIAGLSAAAAVIAVLFFTGLFSPVNQQDNAVVTTSVKQPGKPVLQPMQKAVSPADVVSQQSEESKKESLADKTTNDKSKRRKNMISPEENNGKNNVPETVTLPHQLREEVAVSLPSQETQLPQRTLPDNKITAKQVSVLKLLDEAEVEQTNTTTALSLSDNNIVQPAVYKELNTDDDNHTLYVSGVQLNKNKINGFLKSASRLLGGRMKQTEE